MPPLYASPRVTSSPPANNIWLTTGKQYMAHHRLIFCIDKKFASLKHYSPVRRPRRCYAARCPCRAAWVRAPEAPCILPATFKYGRCRPREVLIRNRPKEEGESCLEIGQLEGGSCLEIANKPTSKQDPRVGIS